MVMKPFTDEYFMKEALKEARIALEKNEVPVGAVIVAAGRIIARGHNMSECLNDFTAHAEMIAFTSASAYLNSKYLDECTLYVTVEPCPMCAGASFWTRISRIVFGADDPKMGFRKLGGNILHPSTEVEMGVLKEECSELMRNFFKEKR